ncbi:cytochrome c oxidase subunit 5B, mitochondrial-like [Tachypleus tridentatus]|uniref:cytochrome c oxidase subunit 5B, mitochondrial-like n=1 Tax=Tachypleus tridentatus TaxID=6853 RepID=UPI003FD200C8
MASFALRKVISQVPRNVLYLSTRSLSKNLIDTYSMEHATGLEKKELMAKAAGNENPFDMRVYKRGPGTKTDPNIIPSAYQERLIGCICEEDATCINWMWLEKGEPKRCECGYWFKLIDAKPL